jgi:peptide deformylase
MTARRDRLQDRSFAAWFGWGLGWLALGILSACSDGDRSDRSTGSHATVTLGRDEVRLIHAGGAEVPMRVVLNTRPEEDAVLRLSCRPVRVTDPHVDHLVARMLTTVKTQDGVGIAAPQVGVNRRVILVQRLDRKPDQPFVPYHNPEIVSASQATVVDWEGCLSVSGGYGRVRRARAVVVAHDEPGGVRRTEKIEGFTARIFQHEVDHLNGVLFIDRLEDGRLVDRATLQEIRRREREAAGTPVRE